jgi:SAM-dependent methyltransferase
LKSAAGIRPGLAARYLSHDGCRKYQDKYRRWNKRLSHRRECAVLERLLRRARRAHSILDAPCGPGRFFDVLQRHADEVHLGDMSPAMLTAALRNTSNRAAGYHRLNLVDTAPPARRFDGVVSVRLMHHLYSPDDRATYLDTLARLAERWLILTFRDARAPRTITRQLRRCFTGDDFLAGLTVRDLKAEMSARGFRLAATEHLSAILSGHRYALFERG